MASVSHLPATLTEARLEALERQLAALREAVARVFAAAGRPVPAELGAPACGGRVLTGPWPGT